jgi:hypothetical protein
MPIKGTYYNATLGAAPTRVTSNNAATQIGTIVTGSNNTITTVTNNMTLSTIQIVNTGIYLITFHFCFGGTLPSTLFVNISGPSDSQGSGHAWNGANYGFNTVINAGNYALNGTVIVPATNNSTYNFILNYAGSSNSYTGTQSYSQAIRIG